MLEEDVVRRKPRTPKPKGFGESRQMPLIDDTTERAPWAEAVKAALAAEADSEGLLAGEKSQHVTFRVPPALLDAAKRKIGIESTSELGMLALLMLAQTDPVAAVLKRTRGALGPDHTLEV